MPTDLEHFIDNAAIFDTHEHMMKEDAYVGQTPDVLCELFNNYVAAELVVAGAAQDAVNALIDSASPDIEKRFAAVKDAWDATQFTGYGEAVRLIARRFFNLDVIDGKSLAAAQSKLPRKWPGGERLRILRDEGKYDHIQVDDFCWKCAPDTSGPDFFLYDLSWASFCGGNLELQNLHHESGLDVKDLSSLREAMAALFAKYAPFAIAVKAQHAYGRTLLWNERSDADAAAALSAVLCDLEKASVEDKNCLGDWCWARGVELAIEYNLPFKIHTGYYAGHSRMPVEFIQPGNLCGLLKAYPKAKFVLMHIGYPYDDEIVALAKHYPNVWVDLCWAWAINPRASADFVRRFIHAAPANKLFGFGGDISHPRASVAYSMQARRWLTKALQAEVDADDLNAAQAIRIAKRLLQDNQRACFELEKKRSAIHAALKSSGK
jgi:hypothetical protein